MHILFLDDMPERVAVLRPSETISYVRTYSEFQDWLRTNGTPDIISFDHDLSPSHYVATTSYVESSTEPTGEDAAAWAIEKGFIPKFAIVHSWNPDGAKRIAHRLADAGSERVFLKMFHPKMLHVPQILYDEQELPGGTVCR